MDNTSAPLEKKSSSIAGKTIWTVVILAVLLGMLRIQARLIRNKPSERARQPSSAHRNTDLRNPTSLP